MATKNKDKDKTRAKTFYGIDLGFDVDERILKWSGILIAETVAIGLIVFLVAYPQIVKIQKANKTLAEGQKDLADLQYKSELLTNFIVEFSTKQELLNNIFPQGKDVGLILNSIRKLATDTVIELVTYSVQPSASGTEKTTKTINTPSVSMDLTINGSAQEVQAFVKNLDRSLPLKAIENLQVIRNLVTDSTSSSQLIQTKLTIRTYYLPYNVKVDSSRPLDPFGDKQIAALQEISTYSRYSPAAPNLTSPTINNNIFGN